MSRFTFLVRLPETPSDDDLIRMKASRALLESVTGMQSTSGTFSLCGNKRSDRQSVDCDCIPRKWLHEAEVLVQQGLISGYEHFGEIEQEEPKADEPIGKSKIRATLHRLRSYYGEQAKLVIKNMQDCSDAQSISEYLASALRWEAKQEAMQLVAAHLKIDLETEE